MKPSEPPPSKPPVKHVYNKRLQSALKLLDANRPDLERSVSRLKEANARLEKKVQ